VGEVSTIEEFKIFLIFNTKETKKEKKKKRSFLVSLVIWGGGGKRGWRKAVQK
jgi:hypothetical protein